MKKILCFVALCVTFVSCGKQDAVYKEFIKNGGYVYPAKPMNVEAQQGYQRIILKWEKPMDPSIRTSRVYWDSYTQSRDFDYSDFPDGKLSTVVDGLEDRSYTFNIVNFDADGNKSLAAEVTASPFGDSWLVSHAERNVVSAKLIGSEVEIKMSKATDEIAATKFRYIDADGQTVESKILLFSDADVVRLPNPKRGKYFEYQSAYCAAGGIDTVWTGNWMKSAKPISYSIDKNSSSVSVTTGQIRDAFVPSLMFDGITDSGTSRWYSANDAANRGKFPKIIVIDSKKSGANAQKWSSFTFYQDPAEDAQTRRFIRSVYVYVSDTKFNPDDSNYSKNFGEPVLQAVLNSNEPVQEFFPSEEKAGRYIALVFRNSYNSTGFIDLWELDVFGYLESELN